MLLPRENVMRLRQWMIGTVWVGVTALFCVCPGWAQTKTKPNVWVGTWASSQQIPEPYNALPTADMTNMTMRQIVEVSAGGDEVRVRLSNAFGREPLRFDSVHIAEAVSASSSAIVPGSDQTLTFFGSPSVIVPAGAEYWSDPIQFHLAPLSNVAITFYLSAAPVGETSHPGSRETTYYEHGNEVSALTMPDAKTVDHWFELSGVDVLEPAGGASIVALGDSITDGHASTTNGNNRWTNVLAERLQATPGLQDIGVLNEGIGGNHLLTNGLGPNVLARFNRDVLAQDGVRWLIVLEGVNDLGGLTYHGPATPAAHALLVHRLEAAYEQIIVRAHAAGIRVIGGTITPYMGSDYYHPGAANEHDWEELNAWIRAPGHFDAVIDFARAVRDPKHPDRLNPSLDSGDHLHPSPAGYRVMGDAVPLGLFRR